MHGRFLEVGTDAPGLRQVEGRLGVGHNLGRVEEHELLDSGTLRGDPTNVFSLFLMIYRDVRILSLALLDLSLAESVATGAATHSMTGIPSLE